MLLGGSWVDISRVVSRVAILITHIRGLITPLTTTYEPPSTVLITAFITNLTTITTTMSTMILMIGKHVIGCGVIPKASEISRGQGFMRTSQAQASAAEPPDAVQNIPDVWR